MNLLNFFRKPRLEHISILQVIASQAVTVVERPGQGAAKKREAVELVAGLAKSIGLPVPPTLIDLAVEAAARNLPRGQR